MEKNAECRSYYQDSYESAGFNAQRKYPNEELMRFLGREYGSVSLEQRKNMRALEVGCGSGGNLWAISHEGFETYGIDLSEEGIALCRKMMAKWGAKADLKAGDMTNLPYPDQYFDMVLDIFSSYCLQEDDFVRYLDEVSRVLKPGGKYFSYAPSTESDAFKNHEPAKLIGKNTLDGIHRQTSPFFGNAYPVRFINADEYVERIEGGG